MESLYLNSLQHVGPISVFYWVTLLQLKANKLSIVDGYFDLSYNTAVSRAFAVWCHGQYQRQNGESKSVSAGATTLSPVLLL